jgi:hypothetical protein
MRVYISEQRRAPTMPEALQVKAVDELAREFEVEDLAQRLMTAGVELSQLGDRYLVPVQAWTAFVRSSILAAPVANGGAAVASVVTERWGDRYRKLAHNNPSAAHRWAAFVAHVRKHGPEVTVKQTKTTTTLILPGGRWAGLVPRSDRLIGYAIRGGKKLTREIRGPDDFASALEWYRQLPPSGGVAADAPHEEQDA